jgi:hypothetical protein
MGFAERVGYGTYATTGTNGTEAVDMDTGVLISLMSPIAHSRKGTLCETLAAPLGADHDFPEMRAAFQVPKGIR